MYTYMLLCSDNSYYTGWTTDLDHRIRSHNSGKGSKYTRSRLPVKFIYVHKYDSKSEAMKEEYRVKQLTRTQKTELINSNNNQIKLMGSIL